MTSSRPSNPAAAILVAAEAEWLIHAADSWEDIDFRGWPRGFHRSAWVIAGFVGWNPLDVRNSPTPAAQAVNALVTRRCLVLAATAVRLVPDPGDATEPLLAWFNAAVEDHKVDIARAVEDAGDVSWKLPRSRRHAARRLVAMWERNGAAAFGDLAASLLRQLEALPLDCVRLPPFPSATLVQVVLRRAA